MEQPITIALSAGMDLFTTLVGFLLLSWFLAERVIGVYGGTAHNGARFVKRSLLGQVVNRRSHR